VNDYEQDEPNTNKLCFLQKGEKKQGCFVGQMSFVTPGGGEDSMSAKSEACDGT